MDAHVVDGFRFALDVALKATLLFVLTGVALLLLRRRSASVRHMVAVLGFGAALLVPLLTAILPRVSVPLLPMPVRKAPVQVAMTPPPPVREPEVLPAEPPGTEPEIRRFAESRPAPEAADAPAIRRAAPAPPSDEMVLSVPVMAWILALWAAGTVALLARLAIGLARVRRYIRSADRVASAEWSSLARSLGRSLALGSEVEIFVTPELPVAVTAGLRHPVLLIPQSARDWDEGRRRIVLLHELAHVARRDWPSLLLAQAVIAVYWFHPLAWMVGRRLRRDGERAADDRVLALGTKPSVYAGHLLGIIRSLKPKASAHALPVMGVARPSHFEERLRAILDPGLARRKLSRGQIQLTALLLLAISGGVAALQPWSRECPSAAAARSRRAIAAGHDRSTCPRSVRAISAPHDRSACPVKPPAATRRTRPDAVVKTAGAVSSEESGYVMASRHIDDSAETEYRNGRDLHEDGRYVEAARSFTRAYEAGYRRPESAYNAACAWARAGKYDLAFEWLEKASAEGFRSSARIGDDEDLASLRSDRRLPALLQKLGRTELEAARRSPEGLAAVERFEALARNSPERGDEFYRTGRELLHLGRYDLAERAFRLSARRGYRTGASLYNAACALSLEGKRSEALDLLQQSLEAGFDDPKLVRNDDDLEAIRSDPRFRALAEMAEALELRAEGKSLLGIEPRRDRDAWQHAAARYEKYASAHPQLGRAWFNLGYARLAGGDASGAAAAFERSNSLDYRRPTSLYNLACSYARMGEKDRAFDALFQALSSGFDGAGMIRSDDDLAPLHGDPRFRKALTLAEGRSSKVR